MGVHTERTSAVSMTVYPILFAISLGHFLNDAMQAVIPALFPILRSTMELSYTQIGWIAFALNMTSSVMQPVVGLWTDRAPSPRFLPLGMASGLIVGLAFGMGALGAVVLGKIADLSSLGTLMGLCSVLPLFGALVVWLLKDRT